LSSRKAINPARVSGEIGEYSRLHVVVALEDEADTITESLTALHDAIGDLILDNEPGVATAQESKDLCMRILEELTGKDAEELEKDEKANENKENKEDEEEEDAEEDYASNYDADFTEEEIKAIEKMKKEERAKAKDGCTMCSRLMPLTWHHLIPKTTHRKMSRNYSYKEMATRGIWVCRPCHSAIHRTHDNMELAEHFNTVEALEECPTLQKWVKYAAKQRPTTVQGKHAKLRYKK